MKPNPGGQLAADEVLGRDRLIARLWQVLERQSLLLTAERRMGKTSVIKKMTAQPLPLPDLLQRLQVQNNLQHLDREMLLKVLSLLQRDHYIGQKNAGAYAFRFPLIQQYWRLSRGLG